MQKSTTEIQTVIEISKNIVSSSAKFFEKRTQVKRRGSVLYVHNYGKMVATITKLLFCSEEVPMLIEGQNFSSIGYMDPVTKIFTINIQSVHATCCTQILSH